MGNRCVLALDGRRLLLDPDTPALLDALASAHLSGIIPGLLAAERDRDRLLLRLLEPGDPFDVPHVERIADAYVHAVTGWQLPAACRLAAALADAWPVLDGTAAAEGVDLLALPAGRVLNWIYARAAEGAELDEHDRPGARARLDRDLHAPLPSPLPELSWRPLEGGQLTRAAQHGVERRAERRTQLERVPAGTEPAGFSRAEQASAFRNAMTAVGAAGGAAP